MIRELLRAGSLAALFAVTGCLGRSDVVFVRQFKPPIERDAARAVARAPHNVVLRSIGSSGHLSERISWSKGGVEFGAYEDLRWTDSPERLVERAIQDELFLRNPGATATGAAGADIAITLEAFEHVLDTPQRARVALTARRPCPDGMQIRHFAKDVELSDEDPETLAQGIGVALCVVVDEVVAWAYSDCGTPFDSAMSEQLRQNGYLGGSDVPKQPE